MTEKKWIDISVRMDTNLLTWPTDPKYAIKKFVSFEKGYPCDASEVSMSVHTGTHIDAPAHFIQGGVAVEAWEPRMTMGACRVIAIHHAEAITAEELKQHNIRKDEIVIFKTKNSDIEWYKQPFNEKFIHVAPDAAEYLATIKPRCIGVDYLSVGSPTSGVETHRHLLGANIWLVETLRLNDIEPGNYEFIFLPIQLVGSDGAPGRALLAKME